MLKKKKPIQKQKELSINIDRKSILYSILILVPIIVILGFFIFNNSIGPFDKKEGYVIETVVGKEASQYKDVRIEAIIELTDGKQVTAELLNNRQVNVGDKVIVGFYKKRFTRNLSFRVESVLE